MPRSAARARWTGTWDASLHGRIEVPAALTATGSRLVVSISNFGGMAVLAVDNPGVWTDEEAAELLQPDDVAGSATRWPASGMCYP
ncbi:hypothetical protein AB0B66_41050 [Catellatospora sp. NPDC049111]|uniref:hypothetical protein n=1 Tax=Catellatospora sp. NPDC049111 TaxID=3155271 RepID=UPI0033FF3947